MYEDGAVHVDAAQEVQYFRGLASLGIHHETPHTKTADSFIVTETAGYVVCHYLPKLSQPT